MANYAITLEAAAGALPTAIGDVSVTTTIPRRIGVYDFIIGSDGTPADTGFEWIVQRSTAHGTRGASPVPKPLDLADPIAQADAGQGTYTIQPTLTSAEELIDMPLNLRATWRWVSAPDGTIWVPATDNAGLVWNCNHASATDNQKVTAHFIN